MPPLSARERCRHLARKAYWRCRSILGPYSCPVCGNRVATFTPFGKGYVEHWERWGFDHKERDFETLNAEQYGCPFCGSSDRDRLCALFVRERVPDVGPPLRFIDFAPSRPLAAFLRALPRV